MWYSSFVQNKHGFISVHANNFAHAIDYHFGNLGKIFSGKSIWRSAGIT